MLEQNPEQSFLEALYNFITAESYETKDFLEKHPELLTQDALNLLNGFYFQRVRGKGDKELEELFHTKREILSACIEYGVTHAFRIMDNTDIERGGSYAELIWDISESHLKYQTSRSLSDLDASVTECEKVVKSVGFNLLFDAQRASIFNHTATCLSERYYRTSSERDLLRAIEYLRQATQSLPSRHQSLPGYYCNLANHLILWSAHYKDVKALEEAIAIGSTMVERLASGDPELDLPLALTSLGEGLKHRYIMCGVPADLDKAIEILRQSLSSTPPDSPHYSGHSSNLAAGLSIRYERFGRLEDLEEAVAIWKQCVVATDKDFPHYYKYLSNIVAGMLNLYVRTRSLPVLQNSLQIIDMGLNLSPEDSAVRSPLLNCKGNALSHLFTKTFNPTYLEESIESYRAALVRSLPADVASSIYLGNLARALSTKYTCTGEQEVLDESIRVFERALSRGGNSHNRHQCEEGYADALLDKFIRTENRLYLDKALNYYQRLVEGLTTFKDSGKTSFTPPNFFGDVRGLARAYYIRHLCFKDSADLKLAIKWYDLVLSRQELQFYTLPIVYQLGQQILSYRFYPEAAQVHLEAAFLFPEEAQHHLRKAFVVTELSKSKIISAQLRHRDLPAPATIPEELVSRERDLLERLANQVALSFSKLDVGGVSLLEQEHNGHLVSFDSGASALTDSEETQRKEQFSLYKQLSGVWEEMGQFGDMVSEYVNIRRGDSLSWESITKLASTMGDDMLICSITRTHSDVTAFCCSGSTGKIDVCRLELSAEETAELLRQLEAEVWHHDIHFKQNRESRDALLVVREGDGWQHQSSRAETWQERLLPFMRQVMKLCEGKKYCLIVPGKTEHLIPWGALAQKAGMESAVIVIPSLELISHLSRRPEQHATSALVVGDPLGDLHYSIGEAQQIGEMLGVRPLIGASATKASVLERLPTARIAHFSTHAYFDPHSPLDSGVCLSDGVLTARDIMNTRHRMPQFVTLSACETGRTGNLGGDESVGLNQAFFYAGAKSILSSLWKVDDSATAFLMKSFYWNWLNDGLDKASSLREAMATTRSSAERWKPTYFWGGFSLTGMWD